VFATNMLTAIGLALGIDYSLFILSRYREERGRGRPLLDAIEVAGATANRAVLFSGFAFTLAMVGLLLVPSTIMRSLAAGAIAAGVVSVAAALSLLPAALALLGDRVDELRIPFVGRTAGSGSAGFWSRFVGGVMRRPLLYLVCAGGLLVAMASPLLRLDSGEAGISTLPDRLPSKQGYLALNEEFPGQTTDPVEIVIDGDLGSSSVRRAVAALEGSLAGEPALGRPVEERSAAGDLILLRLAVRGDALGEEAAETVARIRDDHVPDTFGGVAAEVLVGGDTAEAIDVAQTMDRWLPVVLSFVLGLSFVLLTIAFRSIVVAAKAIVANLLAVAAAYGLLVIVFVDGVGNELLGFERVATIESWVPLFLFAVLFGLSMDYHVFLLSRIRERFAESGDNDDAVAHGIGATGRIITGAALIIVAVFSGFARGDLVMFQQMGFGCGVALLVDATLVRMVLIPAAMTLLGDANWYIPRWLRWLPDLRVEGSPANRPSART
jgi:putative drug exporter of the RND superfamily